MIKEQFMKFIITGIISTIINYSLFYFLYIFISIHYVIAASLGFVLGIFAGYKFNKNWTFGVNEKNKFFVHKYCIVYVSSLLTGLGLLFLLVEHFNFFAEVANIFMIGFTTCLNFIGTKYWVFKK